MEPARDTNTNTTTTRSRRWFLVIQRLTFILVSLFVILMAVIAIAWLVLNPKEPEFRVTSLSLSNLSISDWEVRGTCHLGLTITNPNKKIEMVVDDVDVGVWYGEVGLCGVRVQGVEVGKMDERNMKGEIGGVWNSKKKKKKKVFGDEWRRNGVVKLNMRLMQVRVRYEAGIWPSRMNVFDIFCGDLRLRFFPSKHSGTLLPKEDSLPCKCSIV